MVSLRPRVAIDFTRRLDALKAGTLRRGEALPMGITPAALLAAGLPRLPLLYQQDEARKTLLAKHAGTIDEETLRRLPDVIADPVLVVTQANGRYGALIQDGGGRDVLVVIAPRAEVGRRRVNLVVTVHARDRWEALLADVARGRMRYRHAARAAIWLAKALRLHAFDPRVLGAGRDPRGAGDAARPPDVGGGRSPPAPLPPRIHLRAASGRRLLFREPT
ncbi:MAG TPA: hypothetical protein VJ890_14525 [Vineibacter sp.]|nr:hypothetical protein [Vineibacter sp.]